MKNRIDNYIKHREQIYREERREENKELFMQLLGAAVVVAVLAGAITFALNLHPWG